MGAGGGLREEEGEELLRIPGKLPIRHRKAEVFSPPPEISRRCGSADMTQGKAGKERVSGLREASKIHFWDLN